MAKFPVLCLGLALLGCDPGGGDPNPDSDAQPWARAYGGAGDDLAFAADQAPNGDFILAGETYTAPASNSDILLHLVDSRGDSRPGWPKIIGGSSSEAAYSVHALADGGFVAAGATDSDSIVVVRTASDGIPLPGWPKYYGVEGVPISGLSMAVTSDGGFVVTGIADLRGGRELNLQAFLMRLDSNGSIRPGWPKNYGGASDEFGRSVRQARDGGFILVGESAAPSSQADVFVLRTDAEGSVLPGWPKTFGGAGRDAGYDIIQTRDGGFAFIGIGPIIDTVLYLPVYLYRLDPDGTVLPGWPKTFGGRGDFEGRSLRQTSDGGFVLAGNMEFQPHFSLDKQAFLLRTDPDGRVLEGWPKAFGGSRKETGSCVLETSDGGFLLAGSTESEGAGGADAYLVRTDAKGNLE